MTLNRIMLVDDDEVYLNAIVELLKLENYDIHAFNNPLIAMSKFEDINPELVIVDIMMPELNGIEFCNFVKGRNPHIPVMVISALDSSIDLANALDSGADDYISKPVRSNELFARIRTLLRSKNYIDNFNNPALSEGVNYFLSGNSAPVVRLKKVLNASIENGLNVLIYGPSGTRKTQLAEYLHRHSSLSHQPFVKIDCKSIDQYDIENCDENVAKNYGLELLEEASGGVLLIDNIDSMNEQTQSFLHKQLSLPETHLFRIISTSVNSPEDITERGFNKDLLQILNEQNIETVALKDRLEDIDDLLFQVVKNYSRSLERPMPLINADVTEKLKQYDWPGNFQEFENVIIRSITNSSETFVLDSHFVSMFDKESDGASFNNLERDLILERLEECNWKIEGSGGVAEVFELPPSTLRSKMKKLGIKRPK